MERRLLPVRPRTIRGLMFSFAAAPGASSSDAETPDTGASPTSLVAPVASASPSATAEAFLVEMFADLRDAPVPDENAAELQAVLGGWPRTTGSRRR
jgi:hypothetical protein